MILRSIKVAGWRCFPDAFEVGPFSDGINVLFAPNAFGKSTLFDALLRGVFDGHRVTGAQIEAIRPWGRVLAPEVSIEFINDGEEFRLSKRFLDKPSSELLRREGGKFVRLDEGDAADTRVRELLCGKPSGRGLTGSANWGICQALWAPQGEMELSTLSNDLVQNIQESLGAQVAGGPAIGRLEQMIRQKYEKYFTSSGKLRVSKSASPVPDLKKRLGEASEKRRVLSEAVLAFEEASRRVEDLRSVRAQAGLDAEVLSKELDKTRELSKDYSDLLSLRREREQRVEASKSKHSELKQHIEAIADARKALAVSKEELARLETNVPLQMKEVNDREAEANAAKAALEEVRQGREAVEKADQESKQAKQYLDARQKHADEDALIGKIRDAENILKERSDDRNKLVAPDAKSLRAIRKAISERDDAQVRLDAALITLEIVPDKKIKLNVIEAEESGAFELDPGISTKVKGAPEVIVDLEGVARVRARGPAGSVEELRATLAKAAEKIRKLTLEYGTSDLQELESLGDQAKTLDERVAEANTVLETLLSERSVEGIEQERSRTAARIEKLLSDHEEWREKLPDYSEKEEAARKMRALFVTRIDEAEGRRDAALSLLSSAGARQTALQAELDTTKRQVDSTIANLEKLEADGRDEQERADELKKLALEWDAAQAGIEDVAGELEKLGEDPARSVEKLKASLVSAEKAAKEALEDEKSAEGRLQQLASEGNYTKVAAVEEELQSLEDEVRREDLRLDAIKLLHETVEGCRREVLGEVAKPVEALATGFVRRIAGTRLGELVVTGAFTPEAVTPGVASGERVAVDQLSGGEQEQIHFAVRLALAQVLSKGERQLIVLDDALTATDTGRFARILSLIEDSAFQLQVLVLTCHPEKYRGLEATEFFDLEKMLAGQ